MRSLFDTLKRHLPIAAGFWTDLRAARYFRRRYGPLNREARQRLFGDGPATVLGGPFHGLRYIVDHGWGSLAPKWLGTYESELTPIVHDLLRERPAVIADVGAAEGYYAAGFAAALPGTPVHAFDISLRARRALRRMRRLNQCPNLHVRGRCRPADLQRLFAAQPSGFLLCDIEGGELALLDPRPAPVLERVPMLIECHRVGDLAPAAVADRLAERFSRSHRATRIPTAARDPLVDAAGLPPSLQADAAWLRVAMDEGRGEPQCWLWLQPAAPERNH